MKIEKRKLSDLKPLDKNVRNHGDAQIREMKRAIEQFGQTRPFVIDEKGNILVGNCMYLAVSQMGTKTVDCLVLDGLSEVQKKKLILSDNKIYRLGTDNFDTINDFLKDVASAGDFEIPGFDADIVKRLVSDIQGIDIQVQDYGKLDGGSFAPPDENDPISHPNIAPPESTVEDSPQSRQFIVCPKCGELIYLD